MKTLQRINEKLAKTQYELRVGSGVVDLHDRETRTFIRELFRTQALDEVEAWLDAFEQGLDFGYVVRQADEKEEQ